MMQILELFSGIGGVAEAVRQSPQLGRIHQAVDIDQQCARVYAHNFGDSPVVATIESPHSWQTNIDWRSADAWWLSPPCQPYCRRGRQAADDPRRAAFQQVMRVLQSAGDAVPQRIAMENVPEFRGSDDHQQWLRLLNELGYRVTEQCLCPSAWQRPNRRLRYYVTAWRSDICEQPPPPVTPSPGSLPVDPLSTYLDAEVDDNLWIDDTQPGAFATALQAGALHIVDADDEQACTACFTGGYGKSIKQAGSYLRVGGRLRRFSPNEIQRLLGFDAHAFTWPDDIPLRRRWKMLGNSLALPVVRDVLASLMYN
ncbi:DNA cytosine methyltransferase [Roseimaritima ulvae]|nr:DNA cytosine methyltransferase [Roseimaritima ulvae]